MKILKKYLIVLISVLTPFLASACGGGDYSKEGMNYCFLSEEGFGPRRSLYYAEKSDYVEINIQEWQNYLGNNISALELNQLVYKSSLGAIDSLIYFLKDNKFPLTFPLKKYAVLSLPDKKLAKQFLYYLGFAKRCEKFCVKEEYYWYGDENEEAAKKAKTELELNAFLKSADVLLRNCKYPFLLERYTFQMLRLNYQASNYAVCDSIYKNVANKKWLSRSMKYRSLGYFAATLWKMQNYALANYYYAVLFAEFPEMKYDAMWSFHAVEDEDWQQCLSMAKNKDEKIAMWYMMRDDMAASMENIFELNPNSPLLSELLGEAMYDLNEDNAPERNYSSLSTTSIGNSVDDDLLRVLKNISENIAPKERQKWSVAYAYALVLSSKYEEAKSYITILLKKSNVKEFADHLGLLDNINEINHFNEIREKEKSYVLQAFWTKFPNDTMHTYLEFVNANLASKLFAQGDTLSAVFLGYVDDDFFYKENNLHQAIAFDKKKDKTAFELFTKNSYAITTGDYYERLGIMYFQRGNLKKSLEYFKLDKEGHGLGADPFSSRINDCHDCDFQESTEGYSQIEYVERMVELNSLLQSDPKNAAQYYFEMGNGYYNTTHFGNGRSFYDGAIGAPYGLETWSKVEFLDCSLALKNYLKAFNASRDVEFKAKCLFMAAKCAQNNTYKVAFGGRENYWNDSEKRVFDYKERNKYFDMLNKLYSKTNYYKEILSECGYFTSRYENKRLGW